MGGIRNIGDSQFSFNGCQYIMLDTCSVIEITNNNQEALNFIGETQKNNIALCYSIKTVEEINIIVQSKEIPKDKRLANLYLKNYINKSYNSADRIMNIINKIPNMYDQAIGSIDYNILNQAEVSGREFNLRWGDAVIYSLAKANDIDAIWTYDSDYKDASKNIVIFKGNKKK